MSPTLAQRAVTNLRLLGPRRSLQTARSQLSDLRFDMTNGTDTYARVLQSELEVDSIHQADAAPYFPTRGRAFRKALEAFEVPRAGTFVDLGSGKGKVLILAAQAGFSRVRGIEFSPDLACTAEANLERMRGKLNADVQTLCTDVATYEFQPDESVFFMFAPFGESVMRQVMTNLQMSLDRHPRRIWIIYAAPHLLDLITAHLQVRPSSRFAYGGHDFALLTDG